MVWVQTRVAPAIYVICCLQLQVPFDLLASMPFHGKRPTSVGYCFLFLLKVPLQLITWAWLTKWWC